MSLRHISLFAVRQLHQELDPFEEQAKMVAIAAVLYHTAQSRASCFDHLSRRSPIVRAGYWQPKREIFPESKRDYFLKVVDAQITFETDAQGRATGLVLHQNGINQQSESSKTTTGNAVTPKMKTSSEGIPSAPSPPPYPQGARFSSQLSFLLAQSLPSWAALHGIPLPEVSLI